MNLLNHNLWRRVNVVKVISIPQFNYLPQMLPMSVPIPLLSLLERKRGEKSVSLFLYQMYTLRECVCTWLIVCLINSLG